MNQLQIHRVESVTSRTDHFKKDDDCREFYILNIMSRDEDGKYITVQFFSKKPLLIE